MPTVAELIEEVRDMLDEPTSALWTDPMLKRWIDEANRSIGRLTHYYKDTDEIVLTQDIAEYSLATDILNVDHAYYDDLSGTRKIPLIPRHLEQMDVIWGERQDWSASWPEYFTTKGNQPELKLRLYPVPSIDLHKVELIVSVIPESIVGLADADPVDVPGAWYDILVDYCRYRGFLRDRDPQANEALSAYSGKLDGLLHNREHIPVARDMVPNPVGTRGYVPGWLADPGWDGWPY